MSGKIETGMQTFDSSLETIELRSRQETEMEPTVGETPDVILFWGQSTKGSNKRLIRFFGG